MKRKMEESKEIVTIIFQVRSSLAIFLKSSCSSLSFFNLSEAFALAGFDVSALAGFSGFSATGVVYFFSLLAITAKIKFCSLKRRREARFELKIRAIF